MTDGWGGYAEEAIWSLPEALPDRDEVAFEPEWSVQPAAAAGTGNRSWAGELVTPFTTEEFAGHADFPAIATPGEFADAGPALDGFSVEDELESWAAAVARLPAQVLSALRDGHRVVTVHLLVTTGERDENRLTDLVFHVRQPELGDWYPGCIGEGASPDFETESPDFETESPDFETESPDFETESPDFETESPDAATWAGSAEQIAFRDRVLAAHLARSKARRGAPQRDLSEAELVHVPGTGVRAGRETALAAGRLLAAANADLRKAQQAGDPDALRTIRLDATSGYRGSQKQRELWLGYFSGKDGYYNSTRAAREKLADGPHSEQAVAYMLTSTEKGGFGLGGRIAAPGYSNHQGGIAIDFRQKRAKGHYIANRSDRTSRARWRNTWFHGWLGANAANFGFRPIATEEWHWEYRPSPTAAARPSGTPAATPAEETNDEFEPT